MLEAIEAAVAGSEGHPLIVALDGPGGSGKSTLAAAVGSLVGAAVIDGDDFYMGPPPGGWLAIEPAERIGLCIDWHRQRSVLQALSERQEARWQPYDWDLDNGALSEAWRRHSPADVVILEGTFAAHPELADIVSLSVLLDIPYEDQRKRFIARDGTDYWREWSRIWNPTEDHYFSQVVLPTDFDLIVST